MKQVSIDLTKEENLLKVLDGTFEAEQDIEKARAGVYAPNVQNKKLGRVGQKYGNAKTEKQGMDRGKATGKVAPKDYVKSLGAEKWNPEKIKREMEHHKNMAQLTSDPGHTEVYEHLSKIHKDHPVHQEKDKAEKKEISTARAKATKHLNKLKETKVAKNIQHWNQLVVDMSTEGAFKSGSAQRKAIADKLRAIGKGVVEGLKHEVKELKMVAKALGKFFTGRSKQIDKEEAKAMKAVFTHMAIVATMVAIGHSGGDHGAEAATVIGGAALKVGAVMKAFVADYIQHAGIVQGGKAILTKGEKDDLNKLDEEVLKKLWEDFCDHIESGDIDEKKITKIIGKPEEKEKDMKQAKTTEPKKDAKIKKSEEELLSALGRKPIQRTEADDIIKGGMGAGKIAVKIWVKKKKGMPFQQTFHVGSKAEAKALLQKHSAPEKAQSVDSAVTGKISTNNNLGATLDVLMSKYQQDNPGTKKGTILIALAKHMGYSEKDGKSTLYKMKEKPLDNPKLTPDKLEKMAQFFGKTVQDFVDMVEGGDVVEKVKQAKSSGLSSEDILNKVKNSVGEQDYDAIQATISDENISNDEKIDFLIRSGVKSINKMGFMLFGDIETPEDMEKMVEVETAIKQRLDQFGIDPIDSDGFDIRKIRRESTVQHSAYKWAGYETGLNQIFDGSRPFLVAYGIGGIGKTYTVKKVIKERGLKPYDITPGAMVKSGTLPEGNPVYDYVMFSGRGTVTGMIRAMYEHNGKTIIFDDFDSVLLNEEFENIVKSGLDPGGDRVVSNLSKPIEGVPVDQFKFNGSVICITNLHPSKISQAIFDRAVPCDLSMNVKEILDKLQTIYKDMELVDNSGVILDIPQSARWDGLKFLINNRAYLKEEHLTPRRFASLALWFHQMSKMSIEQQMEHYRSKTIEDLKEQMAADAKNRIGYNKNR